jgi:hypothetical protein
MTDSQQQQQQQQQYATPLDLKDTENTLWWSACLFFMAEIASPSSPVEARSLSSITSIAANPPAYPRNPTQAKLDRVELYIVKVPGSKG